MIVASLVLILGAVVLLILGLLNGSSGLLVGSIGTSLLAAVALVVGVRQAGAARAAAGLDDEDEDEQFDGDEGDEWAHRPVRQEARATVPPVSSWDDEPAAPAGLSVPAQALHERPIQDDFDDEDPPDEPVAQRVTAADAARVARMGSEVLVIDGRPRYHVPGCVHLLGRPYEPLPVSEAVDLGFSPCGLCEPDSALLADARRV
ncbi:hypothetical protein [Catelliglobosispora koreensis]|uniref:hypothetical protein n=1 Tax=Catelliglobosispora koreensis TaxID=129052 RepID=UPI0003A7006D|nr:hypothetical protein [Catelliglobosispora koreensis]